MIECYLSGGISFVVLAVGVDGNDSKLELFTFGVDVIHELTESDVVFEATGDEIDKFVLLASLASFGSLGFFGPRRFGGGAFDAHP